MIAHVKICALSIIIKFFIAYELKAYDANPGQRTAIQTPETRGN